MKTLTLDDYIKIIFKRKCIEMYKILLTFINDHYIKVLHKIFYIF